MKRAGGFSLDAKIAELCNARKRARRLTTGPQLGGFRLVDKATMKDWRIPIPSCGQDGSSPSSALPRGASVLQIFLQIFQPEILHMLALSHPGVPCASERVLFEAWSLYIYVQFSIPRSRRGSTRFPLENAFDAAKNKLKESSGRLRLMDYETWSKILSCSYFTEEFVRGPLSSSLEKIVDYGGIVTLDEKLRGYSGLNSPCTITCPSKPDGSGLWASELGVILHKTELPFVTRIYPITVCTATGEHQRVSDIVDWATDNLPQQMDRSKPAFVLDARYLDKRGYDILKEKGVRFLASVNPVWFSDLSEALKPEVKSPGDWAALQNGEELFVHYYSPVRRIGKRFILTDAFKEQRKKLPKDSCPCWDAYHVMFGVLDRFNARMSDHYWPYRRMNWWMAFHDLVFSIIFVDIYHIYCEIHADSLGENFQTVMERLAIDLFLHAQSL